MIGLRGEGGRGGLCYTLGGESIPIISRKSRSATLRLRDVGGGGFFSLKAVSQSMLSRVMAALLLVALY